MKKIKKEIPIIYRLLSKKVSKISNFNHDWKEIEEVGFTLWYKVEIKIII